MIDQRDRTKDYLAGSLAKTHLILSRSIPAKAIEAGRWKPGMKLYSYSTGYVDGDAYVRPEVNPPRILKVTTWPEGTEWYVPNLHIDEFAGGDESVHRGDRVWVWVWSDSEGVLSQWAMIYHGALTKNDREELSAFLDMLNMEEEEDDV